MDSSSDSHLPVAVALQRCLGYTATDVASGVNDALSGIGCTGGMHGKTVLLKPNLISAAGSPHSCTHPLFIAAVVDWFLSHGARVSIGDSPAFGSAARVCEKRGIRSALRGKDIKVVEFTTPVYKNLACGVRLKVAAEALECDLFVGLPKIKAHQQMSTTMAVKNIFGVVTGTHKAMLHMREGSSHERFSAMILDLINLLPPQLHLADGIEAMHRSGPMDGEVLPLGCLAASISAVGLDTALLMALEIDLLKSPLWLSASKRKMIGSDPKTLVFPILPPEAFHGSGFVVPSELNPIRFNPLRFLKGVARRLLLVART